MSRVVVCNSALAYPPVPDEVLREGDVLLPLVERLEEAVFIPGPGYAELREQFPKFSLRARRIAREMSSLLPDRLGEVREAWGHSAWEPAADEFVNFSLGPLLANLALIEHVSAMEPDEVLAWELHSHAGWWSGRQMVAEIAGALADMCGARLERVAPTWKRRLRDLAQGPMPLAQALLERRMPGGRPRMERPHAADVVFVVVGPTLIPLYDRIAGRLRDEHGLSPIALDIPHRGPSEAMRDGELPRMPIYDFGAPSMVSAARGDARHAARAWRAIARRLAEFEPLADLSPAARRVLARRLRAALIRDATATSFHARLWRRVLDELRPGAVVAFNAYNSCLAPGVLQARERGLTTVCLQHGIWGPYFRAGALLPYDEVLVFGEYTQEMLRPLAAPQTRFTMTGHSMYDGHSVDVQGPGQREELLEGRRHLVLLTTQPVEVRLRHNEVRWWIDVMVEACAEVDARLAIKPHPQDREMLAPYAALAERYPETVTLLRHGDVPLEELIAAADVLVTRFSTTAIEAALLKTPVMTVNLSGGPDQYPYAEEGAALAARSHAEILPTLRHILRDPELRGELLRAHEPFLDRHLGPHDGRATERIAGRIADAVAEGPER